MQQIRTPSGLSKQSKTFYFLSRLFPTHKKNNTNDDDKLTEWYLKGQLPAELLTLSHSQCREKMMFWRRSWLWLYIRVGVLLGHKLSNPEQQGKNNCYQLNRLSCNFQEAETYCHNQRGHLAHTWIPELQAFIQGSPNKETMWWVGRNLLPPPPRKHQETFYPGRALV